MKNASLAALALSLTTFVATGCGDVLPLDGDEDGDMGETGVDGDEDGADDAGGDGDGDGDGDGERPGDGDGDGDDEGRRPGGDTGDGDGDAGDGDGDAGDGDGDAGDSDGDAGDGDGDGDGEASCEPFETDLIGGQNIDTGAVDVYVAGDDLVVALESDDPWLLAAAHVYAGLEEIQGKEPGLYPYAQAPEDPTDSIVFEIPLDQLDAVCGDTLHIGVHAETVRLENGKVVQEETAWGFGPETFDDAWGWHFDHEICCPG